MNISTTKHLLPALLLATMLPAQAAPPTVGEKAPAFELGSLDGKMMKLADATSKGTVVLVVLRGFPGYQCPLCNRQVQEFVRGAQSFAEAGARVVMVYPGPGDLVSAKANEFVADKSMPAEFSFLLDPDYKFTNLYNLRWDAPKETAYPSTFIIDGKGVVRFAKVSTTHGGRTTVPELMEALKTLKHAAE